MAIQSTGADLQLQVVMRQSSTLEATRLLLTIVGLSHTALFCPTLSRRTSTWSTVTQWNRSNIKQRQRLCGVRNQRCWSFRWGKELSTGQIHQQQWVHLAHSGLPRSRVLPQRHAPQCPSGKRRWVNFTAANAAESVQRGRPRTKLMVFFELCQSDSFAATLPYCDVPMYYTWQE